MQKIHDNNFLFIRLFAAICVLLGHSSTHMNLSVFGYNSDGRPFYHIGVQVFFILSAFFLYPSFEKSYYKGQSLLRYYWIRFIRFAPPVYGYLLFTILLLACLGLITLSSFETKEFWAWVISNIILFPVFHPSIFENIGVGVLNGSLWTIVAQFSFYLVLPFIFFLFKKAGFKLMTVILFVFSAVTLIAYHELIRSPFSESLLVKIYSVTFIPYLWYFCLGIFWSKVWSKTPKSKWVFLLSLVLYLFITQIAVLFLGNYGFYQILWSIPLSYSLIWFGYHGHKIFQNFNKLPDISMGIYIWHMVVVNILITYGINDMIPDYATITITIAFTVIMAYLSYLTIEVPSRNLKNMQFSRTKKQRNLQV